MKKTIKKLIAKVRFEYHLFMYTKTKQWYHRRMAKDILYGELNTY